MISKDNMKSNIQGIDQVENRSDRLMDEKLTSACCNTDECQVQGEECCIDDVRVTTQKLVRIFQMFERDQIKVHGFTTSQCYCLLELRNKDGMPMNDLSVKMNLNSSTMTRIVDTLVRDGYIDREKDLQDRRIVIVKLTAKGEASANELSQHLDAYYSNILSHLPVGEIDEVFRSVSHLIAAFEKANPNCC